MPVHPPDRQVKRLSTLLSHLRRGAPSVSAPPSARAQYREAESRRLSSLPRHCETATNLLGFAALIPDGPSFAAAWREVFEKETYRFTTNHPAPRILDCGANVGLSCLFFKQVFPQARLTAFEPDPGILAYLKPILIKAGLTDLELVPKGVWSSATTLRFASEGSDSGRIGTLPGAKVIEIDTVRLKDYLGETIDFLKMDIEGAETEVLSDCADRLGNVRRLFVEYHSFKGQAQTLDQLLALLRTAGFRVQIHPVLASAQPFVAIVEHLEMDLQLNIFAYREPGDAR